MIIIDLYYLKICTNSFFKTFLLHRSKMYKTNDFNFISVGFIYHTGRDIVVVRLLRRPTNRCTDGRTASRMGLQRFQRVRSICTGFDDYRGLV